MAGSRSNWRWPKASSFGINVKPSAAAPPIGKPGKRSRDRASHSACFALWAAGCVIASCIEQGRQKMDQHAFSFAAIVKKPSALLPIVMSLAALFIVLGYVMTFGVVRESDEGAAAHLWQLLMAGQLPVLLFVAVKWLPRAPKQTLYVIAIQAAAVLAAMAPVYFLRL